MKHSAQWIAAFILGAVTGCSVRQADQSDVQRFFSKHKIGSSADYAVMKNGDDHLMTIHGYVDDYSTCMDLIEPYNRDPALTVVPGTYSCERLND